MNLRTLAIAAMIGMGLLAVYAAMSQGGAPGMPGAKTAAARPEEIGYSQLLSAVAESRIKGVEVRGETMTGEFKDGTRFTAVTPLPNVELVDRIVASGAQVETRSMRQPIWMSILLGLLPIFVLVGLFFLRGRARDRLEQAQPGASGAPPSQYSALPQERLYADVAAVRKPANQYDSPTSPL
jgi:cell division protease FtsH